MKKLIALCIVGAFALACGDGGGVSGPSPVPNVDTSAPVNSASTTQVVQPTPASGTETKLERDLTAVIVDGSWDLCVFINGKHPQVLFHVEEFRAPGRYPFPEDAIKAKMDQCGETLTFQIDLVIAGQCTKGSDNISPTDFAFPTITVPDDPACNKEECVDTEWEFVSEELISEDWSGNCENDIVGDVQVGCVEWGVATYEITEKLCDQLRTRFVTRDIRRTCVCSDDECVLPEIGEVLAKAGNPWDECAAYGDYVPVCKTEASEPSFSTNTVTLPECEGDEAVFYICKQSQEMITIAEYLAGACPEIEPVGWSHVTGCVCDED